MKETYIVDYDIKEVRDGVTFITEIGKKELIRCKNCKNFFDGEHAAGCCSALMEKCDWVCEIQVDPEGFCSMAE